MPGRMQKGGAGKACWTHAIWAGLAGIALASPAVSQEGRSGKPATAAVAAPSPTPVAAPEPRMRRLSQSQYANVIAAAFGPDILMRGRLEPAPRTHGLLAIGLGNAAISASGFETNVAIAMDVSEQVTSAAQRDKQISCKPADPKTFDRNCARTFLAEKGLSLFRRPLSGPEVDAAVTISRAAAGRLGDFHAGLRFGLASLLTSPDFLFRIERIEADPAGRVGSRLDAFSKASRLSFYLTDGPPDAALMAAARDGTIHDPAVLAAQADRLIASPLFERGTRAFFNDLFAFDNFASLTKDQNQFPVYDSQVAKDAQEETLRLVVDQVVKRDGDYGGIFTRADTFLTRPLGWIYQVPVTARDGWEHQPLAPTSGRAGILTQISFLALHSHPGRSSPTLRGKFVRETLLCQIIPPPPSGVDFTQFEKGDHAGMTTARERLVEHRNNPSCNGCHKLMDPIGFAMEGFDAQGGPRPYENGKLIDTSGEIDGADFEDAVGLGKVLANSDRARQCIATQSLQYGLGRESTRSDGHSIKQFVGQFRDNDYRYKALVRAIATSDSFYAVSAPPKEPKAAPAKLAVRNQQEKGKP